MKNKGQIVLSIIATVLILVGLFFSLTPTGKTVFNNWKHSIQKADDSSNYETKKLVEDSARGMITAYNADVVIYNQYKDSEDKDEKAWANNAKIRANQTAIKYNEYILKNSYIWEDNIPYDISFNLDILE